MLKRNLLKLSPVFTKYFSVSAGFENEIYIYREIQLIKGEGRPRGTLYTISDTECTRVEPPTYRKPAGRLPHLKNPKCPDRDWNPQR